MARPTAPSGRSAAAIATYSGVLLLAIALRAGCGALMWNFADTDEIYQYLEPAHRLVFGYGIIPWEFRIGARSWLVGGFVAAVMKLAAAVRDDPKFYVAVVGAVFSILALPMVAIAVSWGRRCYGLRGAVITGLLAATWPELLYFAPKPLADCVAADLLAVAVWLTYPDPETRRRAAFFASGLCLGIAFAIRYPLAPIYVLVAAYACRLELKARWVPMMLGAVAALACTGTLDAVTWGYPFQSIWVNFYQDIVMGVTATQGIEPWYWYLGVEFLNWTGVLVPLLILGAVGARRMPFPAILAVLIVLYLSLVGHKAYRFIYPAVPFGIILVGLGTSEVAERLGRLFPRYAGGFVAVAAIGWPLTAASIVLGDHFQIYLHKNVATIDSFYAVGRAADVCGVALVGIRPSRTAGYVYLHRDVPLYWLRSEELEERAPHFNYLIASRNSLDDAPGFDRVSCTTDSGFTPDTRDMICIYRRAGPCSPSPDRTLQSIMEKE